MKKNCVVIALLLLFFSSSSFAREPLSFSEVIPADSMNSDQIYSSVKLYLADIFRSSKDVIQFDSKEDGIIMGNGSSKYTSRGLMGYASGYLQFSFKIEIRDGRYKVTLDGFSHTSTTSKGWTGGTLYTDEKCSNGDLNLASKKEVANMIEESANIAYSMFAEMKLGVKPILKSEEDW